MNELIIIFFIYIFYIYSSYMEEEWQKMIEHEGTMYAILKKYNLYEKKEDYIDICYIGYTKAVNNYDKSKASLRSYIYKCVENEILHELSKEKAQKRQREELSFDFAYDEIGHDLNDIIPSNENIISNVSFIRIRCIYSNNIACMKTLCFCH